MRKIFFEFPFMLNFFFLKKKILLQRKKKKKRGTEDYWGARFAAMYVGIKRTKIAGGFFYFNSDQRKGT